MYKEELSGHHMSTVTKHKGYEFEEVMYNVQGQPVCIWF